TAKTTSSIVSPRSPGRGARAAPARRRREPGVVVQARLAAGRMGLLRRGLVHRPDVDVVGGAGLAVLAHAVQRVRLAGIDAGAEVEEVALPRVRGDALQQRVGPRGALGERLRVAAVLAVVVLQGLLDLADRRDRRGA